MNRLSPDQLDRQLGTWLRDESLMRAPAGLVEDVFARTSRTPQASRWWPPQPGLLGDVVRRGGRPQQRPGPHPIGPRRAPVWRRLPALAGAVAIVLMAVVLAIGPGRPVTGPGSTAGPSPSPAVSPSPSPSTSPSPARLTSPESTTVGSYSARRLDLGSDAAPIHVTEAFGSIWVANIHASDVRRFDLATMQEVARIPVGSASWFAATDDALWVTSQNGTGITRIDPATNTLGVHLGDVPPCAAPVVAFGSLWQAACDANVILEIDPDTSTLVDTIPAQGHGFMVLAGGRLITVGVGSEGLASFDPDTGTFTRIANPAAVGVDFLASDGTTVWVKNSAGIARIDPADGRTVASFPSFDAQAISFSGDHGWLTVSNQGVLEIDLATNEVRRTIPLQPSPGIPLEAGGALWVTDFDNSDLWRIDL